MDASLPPAHQLSRIRAAVDEGRRGGLRPIASCACGWRSRATLTDRLAWRDWADHAAEATRAAA
jgi:hypothetical protein